MDKPKTDPAPRANERHIAELKVEEAAAPGSEFTFFVLGDSRSRDYMLDYAWEKAREQGAKFILNTGDIVMTGSEEEYSQFDAKFMGRLPPMICAVGNHEVKAEGGFDSFGRWLGEGDFHFDYRGCRFIFLNNGFIRLTDEQLDTYQGWLDTDLTKVVVMHCPPPLNQWAEHCFRKGSTRFMDLTAEHGVSHVFMGHIHLYDRQVDRGVTYVITAAAGAWLYKKFKFGRHKYHYVEVTVKDGKLTDRMVEMPFD